MKTVSIHITLTPQKPRTETIVGETKRASPAQNARKHLHESAQEIRRAYHFHTLKTVRDSKLGGGAVVNKYLHKLTAAEIRADAEDKPAYNNACVAYHLYAAYPVKFACAEILTHKVQRRLVEELSTFAAAELPVTATSPKVFSDDWINTFEREIIVPCMALGMPIYIIFFSLSRYILKESFSILYAESVRFICIISITAD